MHRSRPRPSSPTVRADRFSDGLNGEGYYRIEVLEEGIGWKAVQGAAFEASKVHVIDVGATESAMTDREKEFLVAHNQRREHWHAHYGKDYVPLRWSKGLRDLSEVRP